MTRALFLSFLGAVVVLTLISQGVPQNAALAEGDEQPAYVGAKACKKCHFKQYKGWSKESTLAKALDRLKPGESAEAKADAGLDPDKDYTKDPSCLKCHTTGYGTESGYPAVVEGVEWTDEEKERAEANEGVTCEACHGPGSLYKEYKGEHEDYKREDIAALGAWAPITAENCIGCHNEENPMQPEGETWDFEAAYETLKTSDVVHPHVELKHDH